MKTMEIDELIYELSQYDGELTVKVWIRGADKDYPITDLFIDCINEDGIYIDIDDRNLVDLSKVWHDASKEPKRYPILCIDKLRNIWTEYSLKDYAEGWAEYVEFNDISQWAYISDLLPKGGEK